jgi:hypothetical protein
VLGTKRWPETIATIDARKSPYSVLSAMGELPCLEQVPKLKKRRFFGVCRRVGKLPVGRHMQKQGGSGKGHL